MFVQMFALFGYILFLAVAISMIVIAVCAVLILKELKLRNKEK